MNEQQLRVLVAGRPHAQRLIRMSREIVGASQNSLPELVLLLDECRRGRIGRIRAALRSFKRSLTGRSARQQKLA